MILTFKEVQHFSMLWGFLDFIHNSYDNIVKELKLPHYKKLQVGNDQEIEQSERNSHSKNRGVGKKLN